MSPSFVVSCFKRVNDAEATDIGGKMFVLTTIYTFVFVQSIVDQRNTYLGRECLCRYLLLLACLVTKTDEKEKRKEEVPLFSHRSNASLET